ncbi:LysR family transcriptional regulator [Streptomyces hygroscopicus]|uniref:LysR family transcriptional regulator n=1 Tax=Streptomyces hygroscopicus TaxID=1912 RepID=UPI0008327F07|nr:LysR family transcriptional regulator [Streptomyces hygroscopicus]GLV73418.1 LysR family transcriptional regulator [Streptomyces hygroscopicus subsp. hygroscopicus]
MDLRRLEYFLVLARIQHFGRAAEKLHISQPGLSQQIKVLEQEVGALLVDRTTKPVSLTLAGEVLREQGAWLLAQVDLCLDRVRAAVEQPTGTLRVAYTRSGTDLNMHDLVERFRAAYPAVNLSLTSAWTSRNLELLEAREVDVAFARSIVRGRGVDSMVVATEELVVALPEGHPLASSDQVCPDDIVDLPLVHWPRDEGADYYDEIKRQIWGDRPQRVVMEQPEAEHILREVARGVGIAVLDEHRATKLAPAGVCVRRFVEPVPATTLVISWLPQSTRSPLVNHFIEICRTYAMLVGSTRFTATAHG